MNTSPNGIPERTLPSMDFVFSLEPTFVARGFSGHIEQMTEIIKAAIKHDGFAFVDMLQACPTYNHFATHDYLMERVYDIKKSKHKVTDFSKARELAVNTSDKIATGVLYQDKKQSSFYGQLVPRQGVKTTPVEEVARVNVSEYMKEFI